jgi:hypothetical protein
MTAEGVESKFAFVLKKSNSKTNACHTYHGVLYSILYQLYIMAILKKIVGAQEVETYILARFAFCRRRRYFRFNTVKLAN